MNPYCWFTYYQFPTTVGYTTFLFYPYSWYQNPYLPLCVMIDASFFVESCWTQTLPVLGYILWEYIISLSLVFTIYITKLWKIAICECGKSWCLSCNYMWAIYTIGMLFMFHHPQLIYPCISFIPVAYPYILRCPNHPWFTVR